MRIFVAIRPMLGLPWNRTSYWEVFSEPLPLGITSNNLFSIVMVEIFTFFGSRTVIVNSSEAFSVFLSSRNRILFGFTVMSLTTSPSSDKKKRGLCGSLEVTVIFLLSLPLRPVVLMVALISPSPPGGISSAETTVAVQPHEPVAFWMTSIPSPSFFILNT
jgi:hypothetical protein